MGTNMELLVSVIIPIYNTERYLDACIKSVVNQTHNNLQIILVDDGSSDSSPIICDNWAVKDPRIEVIHKSNEGLGLTRNAGLEVAKGEYVSFLDSDDTLDWETYEKCIGYMKEYNAEACYFGRKTMDKNGYINLNPNIPNKLVFQGTEVKEEFARRYFGILPDEEKQPYIQASSCCVLYRREIIEKENIRFCSERQYLSEDRFFNLDICKVADCVCILPESFYNYTYNASSLTKKRNSTKFARCKLMYKKLQEYAVDFPEISDVETRMQFLFLGYSRMILKEEIVCGNLCGWREIYHNVKEICQDKLVQKVYGNLPLELLDRNTLIYINWVLRRRIMLLLIYYRYLKNN